MDYNTALLENNKWIWRTLLKKLKKTEPEVYDALEELSPYWLTKVNSYLVVAIIPAKDSAKIIKQITNIFLEKSRLWVGDDFIPIFVKKEDSFSFYQQTKQAIKNKDESNSKKKNFFQINQKYGDFFITDQNKQAIQSLDLFIHSEKKGIFLIHGDSTSGKSTLLTSIRQIYTSHFPQKQTAYFSVYEVTSKTTSMTSDSLDKLVNNSDILFIDDLELLVHNEDAVYLLTSILMSHQKCKIILASQLSKDEIAQLSLNSELQLLISNALQVELY